VFALSAKTILEKVQWLTKNYFFLEPDCSGFKTFEKGRTKLFIRQKVRNFSQMTKVFSVVLSHSDRIE